jgi:HEPN domain-containing protein
LSSKKIKYWIKISDYDFHTSKAMLESKRYLYVGFMCHQTIEKRFKAYYIKLKNENAPFTYNLSLIAKKGDFYQLFSDEQKNLLTKLSHSI